MEISGSPRHEAAALELGRRLDRRLSIGSGRVAPAVGDRHIPRGPFDQRLLRGSRHGRIAPSEGHSCPECWREWPRAQLDAVLTHERAHARRRDPLFQWLALFNRAMFWFHPLAWWLERRLSALAEEACDAAVLERGHDPREYSECLLGLARAVQRAGTRVNVVAVAMPGSYLPQRVKKIIDGVRAPRISPMRMACTAVACAIPAALFAAGTLEHIAQIQHSSILPVEALPVEAPIPVAPAAAEPARKPSRVLLAQAKAAPPPASPKLEFEVASVRPVNAGAGAAYLAAARGLPIPSGTPFRVVW